MYVCLDQRDASNDAGQWEWTGANVYRASHWRERSCDGTVKEPSHGWPWRKTGLLQPGREWVKYLFLYSLLFFPPVTASSCLNFILNLCGKICPIHYCKTLSLSGEAAAFDEEWRRELGRYRPSNARSLDYGRDRSAGVGQQLALTAPPSSSSSPSPRHESPRHHPPHSRPRYDWWEVWIFHSLSETICFYYLLVYLDRLCRFGLHFLYVVPLFTGGVV